MKKKLLGLLPVFMFLSVLVVTNVTACTSGSVANGDQNDQITDDKTEDDKENDGSVDKDEVEDDSKDEDSILVTEQKIALANHIQQLKLEQKKNVNLSEVDVSLIQDEASLLNLFELVGKNNEYQYEMVSLEPDVENGSLLVEYKVLLIANPEKVFDSFKTTLTGFKINYVEQLKKLAAISTFDVASRIHKASEVKTTEIQWNQQNEYQDVKVEFFNLKADDDSGFLGFDAKFSYKNDEYQWTIDPNHHQSLKGFFNKLETIPNSIIKLPSGAKSFKGKLDQLTPIPPVINKNEYKAKVGAMTWEDVVKEMMYQVRFMLYQQYSDNFSEIDYYAYDEVKEEKVTIEAQGVIKNDFTVNHYVTGWDDLENGGGPGGRYNTQTYKAGDIVKITFRSRWDPNITIGLPGWKPISADGVAYKSFVTPPDKIRYTLKKMFPATINKWYVHWYVNSKAIYIQNQMNLHAPILSLWYVYKPW